MSARIISLFCNKGGVSKTTTTFNLGWKLAQLGKKVLLIDADSQCNLTGMVLQFNNVAEIESFYQKKGNTDIYSEVEGYVVENKPIENLKSTKVEGCPNLSIIPGNIRLGEIEAQIVLGFKASIGIPRLAQFPGLYPRLIKELAEEEDADFVLIDTAPSITGLNESLVMGSDFFIIPTNPDYYSGQAILSMQRFLPRWLVETAEFRNGKAPESVGKYKFPSKLPQFLGYVVQNYRPRSGKIAQAFQGWVDKIERNVSVDLVPTLQQHGLCPKNKRKDKFLLGKFSDFNSLIALSQEHATPVFALSKEQLNSANPVEGKVWMNYKKNIEKFDEEFSVLAEKIIQLTNVGSD